MSLFVKTTEQESIYNNLEKMSAAEIVQAMNTEDKTVAFAVEKAATQISAFIEAASHKINNGGRLFYLGAGTSGRLGILDASECPPTFGVPEGVVIGIIAGGEAAITNAVENAEDDDQQAWQDLLAYNVNDNDVVVGLATSGTTPYVLGALKACKANNIICASISCNQNSPVSKIANFAIEAVVGPEFVTGSTRLKSGTAQKMILNMISTALMIKLGRVEGNRMVNMQLTNEKLIDRGTQMLMLKAGLTDYNQAKELLLKHGTVKNALQHL
jgi:N-acetylmuramic acid 6-phosphate etherase